MSVYYSDIMDKVPVLNYKGQIRNTSYLPVNGNVGDYYIVIEDPGTTIWNGKYVYVDDTSKWTRIENQETGPILRAVPVPKAVEKNENVVAFSGNGAPIDIFGAKVGDIYREEGTDKLYQCVSADTTRNNWVLVGQGKAFNTNPTFYGQIKLNNILDFNTVVDINNTNEENQIDEAVYDTVIIGSKNILNPTEIEKGYSYNNFINGYGNNITARYFYSNIVNGYNNFFSSYTGNDYRTLVSSIFCGDWNTISGPVNGGILSGSSNNILIDSLTMGACFLIAGGENKFYGGSSINIIGGQNEINNIFDTQQEQSEYRPLLANTNIIGRENKVTKSLENFSSEGSIYILGKFNTLKDPISHDFIIGDGNKLQNKANSSDGLHVFGSSNEYTGIGNYPLSAYMLVGCGNRDLGESSQNTIKYINIYGNLNEYGEVAERLTVYGMNNQLQTIKESMIFGSSNIILNSVMNNYLVYGIENRIEATVEGTIYGGKNSLSQGVRALIYGNSNTVSGGAVTAIFGTNNSLGSGSNTLVFGNNNTSGNGGISFIIGKDNLNLGGIGLVAGVGLKSTLNAGLGAPYSLFGFYNEDIMAKVIFGYGTDDTHRKNLFYVDTNDVTHFTGKLEASNIKINPEGYTVPDLPDVDNGTYVLKVTIQTIEPEVEGEEPVKNITYEWVSA